MERRKSRRITGTATFYIPVAILFVIVFMLMGTSVFLRIANIEVTGVSKYIPSEIIKESGIAIGDSILKMDIQSASERISSIMPYIEQVDIQYTLPDTVHITVKESYAVASIAVNGGVAIVNAHGKILEITDKKPKNSIEIIGFTPLEVSAGTNIRSEPNEDTKLRYLLEVLTAIDEAMIQDDISYVDVTNFSRINIGYKGMYTVLLGGSTDALDKFKRLPIAIAGVEQDADFDATSRYMIDTTDTSGSWRCTPIR